MDKMKVISHILLLFDIKHMLFFLRGQLSNLDKLDKIAKVNIRRGLVMFLSLPSSLPQPPFQTLFCLVNPSPECSVTVQRDKTTPSPPEAGLLRCLTGSGKLHSCAPENNYTALKICRMNLVSTVCFDDQIC